jgi:hypothetical protein
LFHFVYVVHAKVASLNLSGNNQTGDDSPVFIRHIASALETNTTITELNVSGNKLNTEACRILVPKIGRLIALNLANNDLRAKGAGSVISMLKVRHKSSCELCWLLIDVFWSTFAGC